MFLSHLQHDTLKIIQQFTYRQYTHTQARSKVLNIKLFLYNLNIKKLQKILNTFFRISLNLRIPSK